VFRVLQQQYASGGSNTSEIQSPTFRSENLRSGLNWLCLANVLVEGTVFESEDYLHGENLRSSSGDDGACALFSSWRRRF
jgi:hypothetical protein